MRLGSHTLLTNVGNNFHQFHKMAAVTNGVSRVAFGLGVNPMRNFLQLQKIIVNSKRTNLTLLHGERRKEHNDKYEYEVSSDPEEWKYVEKLLPFVTVPEPEVKSVYPSGWRPMKEEALNLPYFVERTRNHMLPVYLHIGRKTKEKKTELKRIHGDLWGLFEDLNKYVEEQLGEETTSYIHEGNNKIFYKGDVVYYVEQWLLSKGF